MSGSFQRETRWLPPPTVQVEKFSFYSEFTKKCSNEDIFDFPLADLGFLGYVRNGRWVGGVSQTMYAHAKRGIIDSWLQVAYYLGRYYVMGNGSRSRLNNQSPRLEGVAV